MDSLGACMTMRDAWFWSHVLGLSLSMVALCAPGTLGAWTPNNQSANPTTTDFYSSSTPQEDVFTEAASLYSDSPPASQGNRVLPLSSTAGHFAETQTFDERSSISLESTNLTTEPLSSSLTSSSTTEAIYSSTHTSDETGSTHTGQAPMGSPAVSWEPRVWTWTETEDTSLPRDSPDSTLRLGDVTDFISQTAINTDSAYTSTTMSRAGERALLSISSFQNNSTSSVFTEDSSSHQPSATWPLSLQTTETEDYTHTISLPKTEVMDIKPQTDSRETYSEMGHPVSSSRTETSINATENQQTFTSEVTSNLTSSFTVTEQSIGQTEFVISSTPPMLSPPILPTNASGTDHEVSSYETSTQVSTEVHSMSTQNQQGTEGVPSKTEEDKVDIGLITVPPTVISRTDNSLTEMLVTEVFPTTITDTVTERSQLPEEDTSQATVSTTSAPLSPTSTSKPTTIHSTTIASQTHTTVVNIVTILSTKASLPEQQSTTTHPAPNVVSKYTPKPSTKFPTKKTTLQPETSTSPLEVTTAVHSQVITTTSTNGTPTQSTETHTTHKWAGRERTPMVTTVSTAIQPLPQPPRMCVNYVGHEFTCHCQQAWTGPTCNEDVNECERDPCPVGSRCVNTRGSFSCECPLGFDLEDGRTCTKAKTFLGTFSVNRHPHDTVIFKSATMHEIQREIIQLLNASLSVLQGYSRSTLSKKEEDRVRIFAVNMFSISADVTSSEVYNSIQMSLAKCNSSLAHCHMVLQHQLTYHVESLCVAQQTQCNTERSTCTDNSGTASCQCLQGYYKHNPEDLSCLECGDGFKLENGTCVPCMFGFGGFNCGNFYKLIAVVVSPAGGGILLILIIALIVTCFKRDKNDINKIIFKSGDLQMSPYADFPKTNRISMEWGRETIEMQENGSTKNLLQMTDIYYSPALRNADLERNGLYPFTGLPGSRHSCIYPAQWNPSFISDDSRRRDYF
ncbi:protein HEG isoform X2 [Boleophthalmus pectinirostris]|uniref:protein HEG isoform X2 n=1 Tax=Boleophthalmus pectinirostris TaxID=150288 RepID=UPI000A1C4944|nr:protein HEG isoform X2 [Boleophthalmus pectinirostris]